MKAAQTARAERQLTRLPASFFTGGGISGGWGGPGYLDIATDCVSFRASAVLARLSRVERIEHLGSRVTVIRARLLPPGFNSALLIVGQERFVRVLLGWGKRRTILRALTDAGFVLDQRRTWLSLGWRIGSEALRTD
jgi:hypothetical protein